MTARPVFSSSDGPKHIPPTPDQVALARRVNEQLLSIGAKVDFFSVVHSENPPRTEYGAVFQCGAKRRTLLRTYPFDDEAELVAALQRWAAASQRGALYTTEVPEDW